MMNVQQFIMDNGIEALASLGIEAKDYGDFYNLSYSQIDSPKFHPVVKECRGLILEKSALAVLCRPFDRFFNFQEDPDHAKFDLAKAVCYEKIDGSLIKVWYNPFKQEWCAGTRNMAFAEGPTSLGNTFLSVVEKAFGGTVHNLMNSSPCRDAKGMTFIFEVVSPETRVVTPYPDYAAYLLACRCNSDGRYVNDLLLDKMAKWLGVKRPAVFNFTSEESCLATFKELNAFDEGYVCRIEDWRVKIKNPAYLAIAHLRNNGQLSPKRIAKLVWLNEQDEYLSYFPEDKQFFEPYVLAKAALLEVVMNAWQMYKDLDQKSFALAVKGLKCSSILFNMKKGKSLIEALAIVGEQDERILNQLSVFLLDKAPSPVV